MIAADLKPGQWLIRERGGAYLIDSVQRVQGMVYVGTTKGVVAMVATAPVIASDPPDQDLTTPTS